MQTAAQIPQAFPPPQLEKKSNPMVTTSFIIGLLLIIPLIFTPIAGIISTRIQFETGIPLYQIRYVIIFIMGIVGLIGLFAAVIGITQMKLTMETHPIGKAIIGFTLCFTAFSY